VLVNLDILAAIRRVLVVEIAKKHMLQTIGSVKNTRHDAFAGFFQRVEKHLLSLFMIVEGLFQECLFVNDALVESPGVFCQAQSREIADQFGQVDRVIEWPRNRKCRLRRIDIDRSYIQSEVLVHFGDIEPGNSVCVDAGNRLERQANP
jgi:hypothetical protein